MHYFIFANKDSSIYSSDIIQNTGRDEILEIIKTFQSSSYSGVINSTLNSRALVQFDLSYISNSIVDGTITSPRRFYLNMHICRVEGQESQTNLYVYPVSSSWVQGIGKRLDSIIRTTGVSWTASDGEVPTYWNNTGSDYLDNIVETASLWSDENTFQTTGHYTYELADMRVDVSSIVNSWLSGTYVNNGFLIKRSGGDETGSKDLGNIQFYSTDTHTVYNPKLEVAWDDSSFVTGTLTQSNMDDLFVYAKNLQATYNNRDKARVRISSRPKYPTKNYLLNSPYVVSWYLPSSSYYSIVDSQTEETIVGFDTSSAKISCDSLGNYFTIWCNGLHTQRTYRIKVKVVSGSLESVYDIQNSFKIIR